MAAQTEDQPATGDETGRRQPDRPLVRLRNAARAAWPALLGYALVRLLGLGFLAVWAAQRDRELGYLLGNRFDAGWLLLVAQNGYDSGTPLKSNMAFFPLFPGLMAGIANGTGISERAAGLLVTALASLVAAWGLYQLGAFLHDRRTGVLLAVLWGALPHSVVQMMAYTEALFTCLAVWSLYALLRRRWVTAGVLCLLAGLTRPTATALIAAVGLAALIALVRRRDGWRPAVAMVLAPLGWLGYLTWVAVRTGRPDGWFHIQGAGWGSSFDGGRDTVRTAARILTRPSALEFYLVTLVLLVAVLLLVLSVLDRQPWQLLVYSGFLLVTTIGAAGYYHSKARFLLPAFALLLPVAGALARAGTARMVAILGCLVGVSVYLGGYLLLVWTASP